MAGVKITDLTPLATAASDDLLYVVDVSDTTSGPEGTSKAIEVGDLRGYKVYTALLTQGGVIAPTADILENTLSATPTLTYVSAGRYSIDLTSEFIANKTCVFIGPLYNGSVEGYSVITFNTTVSSIEFITISTSNVNTDQMLLNTPIEIRVYN